MTNNKITGVYAQHNAYAPPLQHHQIHLVRGEEDVPVLSGRETLNRLMATGVSHSHALYRLKRACDQRIVRYMQLDAARRLYAAEDIDLLADSIRDAQG